jgi:hypothetical protein
MRELAVGIGPASLLNYLAAAEMATGAIEFGRIEY